MVIFKRIIDKKAVAVRCRILRFPTAKVFCARRRRMRVMALVKIDACKDDGYSRWPNSG